MSSEFKEACNQLALNYQSLETLPGLLLIKKALLEQFSPDFKSQPVHHENRIGIWKLDPNSPERVYRRREELKSQWSYWSSQNEFTEKSDLKRVVLMGESAAKGFFYDPSYTPASVLQSILRSADQRIEVLDLAKVNLQLEELLEMMGNVHHINPDAIVIFAGNNWTFGPQSIQASRLATFLQNGATVSDLLNLCHDYLANEANEICVAIKNLKDKLKIPILFVIPEFNLLGWPNPSCLNVVNFISKNDLKKWYTCFQEATDSLEKKNYRTAVKRAHQMIKIDQQTNPAAFEILAKVSILQNDWEKARTYLEKAKDLGIMNSRSWTPRILNSVRDSLKNGLNKFDISYVDLKEVFNNTKYNFPDTEYFLDYCHLSAKGINRSMIETAKKLAPQLINYTTSPEVLHFVAPTCNNETHARALFLSAVHSIHWGQPSHFIREKLLSSLKTSSLMVGLFKDYIESKSSDIPDIFSQKVHEHICQNYQLRDLHQDSTLKKVFDYALIDQMLSCLSEITPQLANSIKKTYLKKVGITRIPVLLSNREHYTTSFCQHEVVQNSVFRHGHFRAFQPKTQFHFMSQGYEKTKFKITSRLPKKGGKTSIYINQKKLAVITLQSEWTNFETIIPSTAIVSGLNTISIKWPLPDYDEQHIWKDICSHLLADRNLPWFPVWGEIFDLELQVF